MFMLRNYEKCWRIRAANPGDVIVVDSLSFFVESHPNCLFDYIQFYGARVFLF